jgi:hypothetical protein
MAIAVISDAPGVTAERFEAMQRQLNVATNPPSGGLAQLAGPFEGGWRVISVWESAEAWDAFRRDRLEPAFQQLGFPTPPFQIWPLQSVMIAPQQR